MGGIGADARKPQQFEQAFQALRKLLIYFRENGCGMNQDFTSRPMADRRDNVTAARPCGKGRGMSGSAAASSQLARDSLQAHEPSAGLRRFRRRGYQRFLAFMGDIDLAFLWKRRWFFITMIVGFALMAAPTPSGLTHEGQIVLVMSLMATMLFITEPIPLPTVPLLIIVGQVVLLEGRSHQGGAEPDDGFGAVHHGLADAGGGHRRASGSTSASPGGSCA